MEELTNSSENVITYTSYGAYKADLGAELQKSAESFVKIGYLLKVARDTRILEESGYQNVNEFAQKEFGLEKTQVSRFMRINDRFSTGGYAMELAEEYRGYGYAKLAVMLTLPDEINDLLNPEYSKSEIELVQKEIKEEQNISDIEVLCEEKDRRQQDQDLLGKVVYQLGKDETQLYAQVWAALKAGKESAEVMELLAEGGNKLYFVRIPGEGRMMISIKEEQEEIRVQSVREAECRESCSKEEFVRRYGEICDFACDTAGKSWEKVYGMEFPALPAEEEVAPVQPKSRQTSRVTPAKKETAPEGETKKKPKQESIPEKTAEPKDMTLNDIQEDLPKPNPVATPKEPAREGVETERETVLSENIPGQDSIENNPEYMPEKEDQTGQQEQQTETQRTLIGCIEKLKENIMRRQWQQARMDLEDLKDRIDIAERIQECEEE